MNCDAKSDKFVNACFILAPVLIVCAHRVVTLILLVSFFIWLFWGKKQPYRMGTHQRWLFLSSVGIFAVATLSLVYAGFPEDGERELEKYLRLMLCYPFMAIIMVAKTRAQLFWVGVSLAGIVAGAVGLFDFYWLEKGRANGLGTLNPIFFGSYSLLFSFLSLLAFIQFEKNGQRSVAWLSVIGVVGGVVGLVLSGSRGGAVALPVYTLVILGYLIINRNYRLVTVFTVVSVISIGGFVLSGQSAMRDRIMAVGHEFNAYVESGQDRTSIGWRLYMWETALHAFAEEPIFGHGTGTFKGLPYKSVLRKDYQQEANPSGHAHNEYLHTLATRGVVGLIPLLGLLLVPIHLGIVFIRRKSSLYGCAVIGTALGFSVYGLTDMVFMKATGADAYTLLMSILIVLGYQSLNSERDTQNLSVNKLGFKV